MAGSPTALSHPNKGVIARAHRFLIYFGLIYVALVVLLAIPFFQIHAVYVHSLKWPLFARFDMPEKYGFAPSKALNLQLTTSDNVSLGAWFILSDAFYHSQPVQPTAETLPALVPKALSAHPTVLFLHGNAGTRAVRFRAQLCATLSARLGANVLALDYRGFGDSEGTPSEAGVARDTWAAWDWLAAQGARAGDVLVMGHSLGTGIGAQFVHELEETGVRPRGLALLAPFSNIRTLLDTYYILGLFPLMKPVELIPGAKQAIKYFLAHHFDTLAIITTIASPVVIAHAEDDWDIPFAHSSALFSAVLDLHLPPAPALPPSGLDERSTALRTAVQEEWDVRRTLREKLVERREVHNFGVVEKFAQVVLVTSLHGGHDHVGLQEGVQDVIGDVFDMWR